MNARLLRVACQAAVIGAALSACQDFDAPIEIDPSAPNVTPQVGADAAEIATSGPEGASLTPGVEGSVLFVRLTDPDGTLVLDRPFEWPEDRQQVPPGDYTMVIYWRGCDGNCGQLTREEPFCDEEITLEPGEHLNIGVDTNLRGPGWHCRLEAG